MNQASNLVAVLSRIAALLSATLLVALITASATEARPGQPLTGFGDGGLVRSPIPTGADERPAATTVSPDGNLLVAGSDSGSGQSLVRRYLPNGSPDPTFGTNGRAAIAGNGWGSIDLATGGRTLVGGSNGTDLKISRLLADGSVDPAFGIGGAFSFDPTPLRATGFAGKPIKIDIFELAELSDGRIRAIGTFFECRADTDWSCPNLMAVGLLADGSPDPSFGDGSGVVAVPISGLRTWAVIESNGSARLARSIESTNRDEVSVDSSINLVTLNPNGALAAGAPRQFGVEMSGPWTNQNSRAITVDPDGDLLLGVGPAVLRIPATGRSEVLRALELTQFVKYSPRFRIDGLETDELGRILLSGGFIRGTEDGWDRSGFLARLTADGRPDVTFGTAGFAVGWPGRGGDPMPGESSLTTVVRVGQSIYIAGSGPRGQVSGFNLAAFHSGSSTWLRCNGKPADYIGTNAVDRFEDPPPGTSMVTLGGNDVITNAGWNSICSGDGNDRVVLRHGPNAVYSGAGDDRVNGGRASDTITGGPGNDVLRGGGRDDLLRGNSGNDILVGGPWNDRLVGGPGADRLIGKNSPDQLFGGPGRDALFPGRAAPSISVYRGRTAGKRVNVTRVGRWPVRFIVGITLKCDRNRFRTPIISAGRVKVNPRTGVFRRVTRLTPELLNQDFVSVNDFIGRFGSRAVSGRLRVIDSDHYFDNYSCWSGRSIKQAWVPFRSPLISRPRQYAVQ